MPLALQAAARFALYLRPVADGDLPFLEALYASTRAEEVAQTGWPPEMQAAFLRQQHEAQHRHYRVHHADAEWSIIERGGSAIGRLYWYEGARDVHIVDISLMPEARGAGIGGALLDDLAAHGEALGKGLSIYVEKNNPARRLYLRLGFVKREDHGVYDLMRREPGTADQLKIAS